MPSELDLARDHLIRACLIAFDAIVKYDADHPWRIWARMNMTRWRWRVRNLTIQHDTERN